MYEYVELYMGKFMKVNDFFEVILIGILIFCFVFFFLCDKLSEFIFGVCCILKKFVLRMVVNRRVKDDKNDVCVL